MQGTGEGNGKKQNSRVLKSREGKGREHQRKGKEEEKKSILQDFTVNRNLSSSKMSTF